MLFRRRACLWLGMVSIVLGSLSGCSLLVSTSDLARDKAPGVDGSGDGIADDDGGPQDPDGGPINVGDAQQSDGGFCEGTHTLCADFDSDPVTRGWSGVVNNNGGSLTRDVSGGESVLAARVPASPTTERSARLYFQVAYLPSRVKAEMDLTPCATGRGFVEMFKLELVTTPNNEADIGFRDKYFMLGRNGMNWSVFVSGITSDGGVSEVVHNLTRGPSFDLRSHLSLDITLGAPTSHVKAILDRNEAQPLLDSDVATPTKDIKTATLVLGTFTAGAPDPCTNVFDNVVLDAIP